MIITGIAHPMSRLRERSQRPSLELAYLAVRALQTYGSTGLITTLVPGWEQALAKAALELEIPYTIVTPFPKKDFHWGAQERALYEELLAQASEVRKVTQLSKVSACLVDYQCRIQEADLILALWDYDFQGETYAFIEYAIQAGKKVVNLWQDWEAVLSLRKIYGLPEPLRRHGAQIYEVRKPH